jgi:hypothetical protein
MTPESKIESGVEMDGFAIVEGTLSSETADELLLALRQIDDAHEDDPPDHIGMNACDPVSAGSHPSLCSGMGHPCLFYVDLLLQGQRRSQCSSWRSSR